MNYRNVIVSLSEGLQQIHLDTHRDSNPVDASAIADEIITRQRHIPDYLRFPIRTLTHAFNVLAIFRGGKRFQHMPAEQRIEHILAWKRSRLGLCRNLIRFYESLFLLIALQEPES
jgi:hypothetical protein